MKSLDEEECKDSHEDETQDYTINPNKDRNRQILELIEDKLDDDWYKGTDSDDDDLEGIVDYLDLQGYDVYAHG